VVPFIIFFDLQARQASLDLCRSLGLITTPTPFISSGSEAGPNQVLRYPFPSTHDWFRTFSCRWHCILNGDAGAPPNFFFYSLFPIIFSPKISAGRLAAVPRRKAPPKVSKQVLPCLPALRFWRCPVNNRCFLRKEASPFSPFLSSSSELHSAKPGRPFSTLPVR